MEKVTMQDIADMLNISRVTVWKVLNNQPGVSKKLRDKVLLAAIETGYIKNDDRFKQLTEENGIADSNKTVSVVISRTNPSIFWLNIIHSLAKELDKCGINLMYNYIPSSYYKGYTLPDVLSNGKVEGMIIMNVYDTQLLSMLNDLSIPKVFLDVSSDFSIGKITGDLIVLEGRKTVKTITSDIIKKGRTEIGFIGDIHYALTNKERYEGFVAAMEENNLEIQKKYCMTGRIGIHTYYEEISSFLDSLDKLPEAFVCVSDFVANFLMQYLIEHGYEVPKDVAITGYDGSTEYSMVSGKLTTVNVDTLHLGKRLAKQLLYRMEYPKSPIEITHIRSDIIWGKSTDF
ncbi:MAG: LacI family DNA-binding transcriptional regulator [Caldicoprobacterales bacterium]|jgi:LacI family transcriptional regulator|nr:LacI family transcriptional regulator [Clostridiales bacterium]